MREFLGEHTCHDHVTHRAGMSRTDNLDWGTGTELVRTPQGSKAPGTSISSLPSSEDGLRKMWIWGQEMLTVGSLLLL